jgi:hypothetical protein
LDAYGSILLKLRKSKATKFSKNRLMVKQYDISIVLKVAIEYSKYIWEI